MFPVDIPLTAVMRHDMIKASEDGEILAGTAGPGRKDASRPQAPWKGGTAGTQENGRCA